MLIEFQFYRFEANFFHLLLIILFVIILSAYFWFYALVLIFYIMQWFNFLIALIFLTFFGFLIIMIIVMKIITIINAINLFFTQLQLWVVIITYIWKSRLMINTCILYYQLRSNFMLFFLSSSLAPLIWFYNFHKLISF